MGAIVVKRIGWSALVGAILIGLSLVNTQSWMLVLGGAATLVTLLLAWRGSSDPSITAGAVGATILLIFQGLLPPFVQWGNGLALTGVLILTGMSALLGGEVQQRNRDFRAHTLITLALAFVSSQFTFLRSLDNFSAATWLVAGERAALAVLGLAVFYLVRRALARQHQPLVRRLSVDVTLVFVVYLAMALSPLWAGRPAMPDALLLASVVEWGLLIALFAAVIRLPNKADTTAGRDAAKRERPAWRVSLDDYLTLMKYRVASLLLVTTLGAMVVAAQGWPGWALVGWVMLGGTLSVGGAGALNHYLDRDIDQHMGRTSLRPIPAGRMAPWKALVFGIVLSILQFVVFWYATNPLTAWLSTGGLLYYVVLYTMILKRTSTQNIVVGGAAGAFPPLVGWAAVTGDLSLGALFLFAIVFYWTPPHFWALALMRKTDYERAGVPMLPVVFGEAETRRQILLYSVLMIALTTMMVPLRLMGWPFLLVALLLNGKFLWDAVKLYRVPTNQSALTLYKYSLLYLALLFVAMAVDRSLLI